MSFRSVDLECPSCGYGEEYTFDLRGIETEEEKTKIMNSKICPVCCDTLKRVWRSAPRIGTSKNSPQEWSRMKSSFKEHYVKHELDDIRNKHGRAIDESHVGAALEKATGAKPEEAE
jgi:hypothetical protein